MTIRVLLADDQALLVTALSTILNTQPDIDVVSTADNGRAAVAACREHLVDVAVLDIRMPGMDGIAAARLIRAQHPTVRIIILTTFNDDGLVREALEAGVHGFLLKDADPDQLCDSVRCVARGESVLASAVTGGVLDAYRAAIGGRGELSPAQRQGIAQITSRERDVLLLVGQGATNPEIAEALHIAPTTVKTHVSALMSKLAARDRVALVLTALKAGLLPR
ncbi:response regulator transcription factor [Corynebacterium sp.]|uniref:response regulator transcription factor n=1 Tax=Corynebacterium sp. TaxID=1720 RepID=UPI0026DC9ECA|nr:response regulator transcription factor [Corynebacterium sp.]MDO5031225.1 response regulator transcription factor [Corynebacterium sp.]